MDHKAVVRAAVRGQLPPALVQDMKRRHGYDPVEVSQKILYWERIRTIVMWLSWATLLLLGVVGLLLKLKGPSEVTGVLTLCSFAWLVICVLGYAVSDHKADQHQVPKEVRNFGYNLSRLLEWVGRDLASITLLDLGGLHSLADRILIDQAKTVVSFERQNSNVPQCHWKETASSLKGDFASKYRQLKSLGLCEGPFHRFYDAAYEELDDVVAA